MLLQRLVCLVAILLVGAVAGWADEGSPGRWSVERANAWYAEQPWMVGANFVPSTAINQLEMWQADTFDPETIDRELGYAAGIGMNTMRVFLHDLVWKEDPEAYLKRIDEYLAIADRHGIKTMVVFFDGVWHPVPESGPQPEPVAERHNSGWVQSPGKQILGDPARHDELRSFVVGVLRKFGDDPRVVVWDLFNEPDNSNAGKWGGTAAEELPPDEKAKRATQLLRKAFQWARSVNPSQPLTAGVWGEPDWYESPSEIEVLSLAESDVISFHTYQPIDEALELIAGIDDATDRPLLCTEYMARTAGSTFEGLLPEFKRRKIAAYNWGLVSGRSQTIYPWSSWWRAFDEEPKTWFHDVFRPDGTPFAQAEADLIRDLTASE
ncbi:MAG: cellulase family glycosylhydrolase [Planctomycetota bacterium]